uniref:Uncharacterized protein n=1 Tax=Plectus sambesii TaxID=2011161 RepID=A0A914VLN9_9BILA
MKTAIIIALCVAFAIAQPIPNGPPPCPAGVAQSKCDAFFSCMPKPPTPPGPPPAQGTQGSQPPPPPPSQAQDQQKMQAKEAECFATAGMTAADQQIMKANKPAPPQGPPPQQNGQGQTMLG